MPRTKKTARNISGWTPPSELRRCIESNYRDRTAASAAEGRAARSVLPQGVSGAAKFFDPYPIYVTEASGGRITDLDGHEYVDLLMGAGPNILGHRYPTVMEAVEHQLSVMTQMLAPTRQERQLAERLRGHMDYLERIRFTNTGSEAVRTCLRIARAFTGRTMLAKIEGTYHGSDDYFLLSSHSVAGPPDQPHPAPESAGIPDYIRNDVLILPADDPAKAEALIAQHRHELAAVFAEPIAFSSGGAVPLGEEYAGMLRHATQEHSILLVFDEVVTGLRMGLGGAPTYLGVRPDLSAVGKALGGGFPLAGLGGRADVLEAVLGDDAEAQGSKIFQSGTFTGHPVSLAAGMATLDVLETGKVLPHIDRLGATLRGRLTDLFEDHPIFLTGIGSVFQLHVADHEPQTRRDVIAGNREATRLFLLAMVARGVLWPPVHPGLTAFAHTDEDIDVVIDAVRDVLELFSEYLP